MRRSVWVVLLAALGLGALGAVASRSGRVRDLVRRAEQRLKAGAGEAALPPAAGATRKESPYRLEMAIYDAGLKNGWSDYGWAPRTLTGGPASFDLSSYAGWIVAHPGLKGRFEALVFRLKAPADERDFLEVMLGEGDYPPVKIVAAHRRDVGGGWQEVLVPMSELNPGHQQFDRIRFRADRPFGHEKVLLDKIGLTHLSEEKVAAQRAEVLKSARPAPMAVDCSARATHISPFVYGVAGGNADELRQQAIDFAGRRWGGNPTSTYNWELHAWNTSNDWFFENVHIDPYTAFLDLNQANKFESFVTVPILGWVAKDTTSSSFPASEAPKQARFDDWRPQAGNGETPDGKKIASGPPTRAYLPAPPEYVARWVRAIRERDARTGGRSVREYILDNEPMLWNSTHRDVHPEPATYDEVLDRTIRYGTAVREADPGALIAGPALWGWPAYLYSALDAQDSFRFKPDYRAHGSMYFLPWWLKALKAHELKTGKKLVDVVDVHFYPQGDGIYVPGKGNDALRLRSTRGLWDPTYVDESWIKEAIRLIPRLKEWIAENNPGLGIQIGEWSFGGDDHISGGLASAEALGRFGALGVYAAFRWGLPKLGTPTYHAFRAFRDFDGAGGRFQDFSLPARAPEGTSLFASRDVAGKRAVLVVLNFSPGEAIAPRLELTGCGPVTERRTLTYEADAKGFTPVTSEKPDSVVLPPSSITVIDLRFEQPMRGTVE
jgi:Glycoside hydrolase family 44